MSWMLIGCFICIRNSEIKHTFAMAAKTVKRRLHHEDVDERKKECMVTPESDTINEALLRNYDHHASQSEVVFYCFWTISNEDKFKHSISASMFL